MKNLLDLEHKLNYYFNDRNLLKNALLHKSLGNERKEYKNQNNERLELLGDAVLDLIVAEYLYKNYKNASEGTIAKLKAMRAALKDANIPLEDVTYINAHGTSTPTNDIVETRAIKALFGDKAKSLYVSSTKGATGHALGGAGGIEGVIIAKTIAEGIIPPTINLYETEEECDWNYVPNKAIKTDVKVAMSNSLGFGGHNSVIVMKKFEK